MLLLREATIDDLDPVIALTKRNRARHARLHPHYWPPAENADEMHAKFLEFMLSNPDMKKLALVKDSRVVGFAAVQHQPLFAFIDDICLQEEANWKTEGVELLRGIEARPAISTIANGQDELIEAAYEVGLTIVATHRLFQLGDYESHSVAIAKTVPDKLVEPPTHIFITMMEQQGTAIIEGDEGGYAVVSQSVMPPPILDTGGTSAIIDRVVGNNRRAILAKALSFAQDRGDVGAILIVGAEDQSLADIADSMGASHPVNVLKWPE